MEAGPEFGLTVCPPANKAFKTASATNNFCDDGDAVAIVSDIISLDQCPDGCVVGV